MHVQFLSIYNNASANLAFETTKAIIFVSLHCFVTVISILFLFFYVFFNIFINMKIRSKNTEHFMLRREHLATMVVSQVLSLIEFRQITRDK